jgi:hypothetical protein
MDLRSVLARLREERAAIDAAISDMERLKHERRGGRRQLNLAAKGDTNNAKPTARTSKSGA